MTYLEWLMQQSPERRIASIDLMALCRKLGDAQRTAPIAPETLEMQRQVAEYYRKWGS
jgi:hypothetical protein